MVEDCILTLAQHGAAPDEVADIHVATLLVRVCLGQAGSNLTDRMGKKQETKVKLFYSSQFELRDLMMLSKMVPAMVYFVVGPRNEDGVEIMHM